MTISIRKDEGQVICLDSTVHNKVPRPRGHSKSIALRFMAWRGHIAILPWIAVDGKVLRSRGHSTSIFDVEVAFSDNANADPSEVYALA